MSGEHEDKPRHVVAYMNGFALGAGGWDDLSRDDDMSPYAAGVRCGRAARAAAENTARAFVPDPGEPKP